MTYKARASGITGVPPSLSILSHSWQSVHRSIATMSNNDIHPVAQQTLSYEGEDKFEKNEKLQGPEMEGELEIKAADQYGQMDATEEAHAME